MERILRGEGKRPSVPLDFFAHVCYNGSMALQNLTIIGKNALIQVAGIKNVPAKIDTGADSSSIWASDITINPENQLEYRLFAPQSQFYTGELITTSDYTVQRVRSSTGHVTVRYRVKLPIVMGGRRLRASFTLYDRSTNNFPILIGRRLLNRHFLVDVSRADINDVPKFDNTDIIEQLSANPQAFHAELYRIHQDSV